MKAATAVLVLQMILGASTAASGQIPERFHGAWVVEADGTSKAIAADLSMPAENKPGWTERWTTSEAELQITESAITLGGLGGDPIVLAVTVAENLGDRASVSAVMPGPSSQQRGNVSIELHLTGEGSLNLRIREENDFDLVVWKRASSPTRDR